MAYLLEAARRYFAAGFSLIPCKYKAPTIKTWQEYKTRQPTLFELKQWFDGGFSTDDQSIGLLLGEVSHNVVAVDLDGILAMKIFQAQYPHLTDTRIVVSGSGKGVHLYYRVQDLPVNMNVRIEGAGFEVRGNGQYVIAPPSPHPSGNRYAIYRDAPIKKLENLNEVTSWLSAIRESRERERQQEISEFARPVPVAALNRKKKFLEKVMGEEEARVLTSGLGNRNQSLFYAGLRLANFSAGGELSWDNCAAVLLAAALSVGTPEPEARRTIASAWRIGSKNPKKVK